MFDLFEAEIFLRKSITNITRNTENKSDFFERIFICRIRVHHKLQGKLRIFNDNNFTGVILNPASLKLRPVKFEAIVLIRLTFWSLKKPKKLKDVLI